METDGKGTPDLRLIVVFARMRPTMPSCSAALACASTSALAAWVLRPLPFALSRAMPTDRESGGLVPPLPLTAETDAEDGRVEECTFEFEFEWEFEDE